MLCSSLLLTPLTAAVYSQFTHQTLIDVSWERAIRPLLMQRYPGTTTAQLTRPGRSRAPGPESRLAGASSRGAIIRRGKTYYVKYRTPAGKQKWESGFPNRSQAQQRLNQCLGETGHGSYVEPKTIKFEKFAEEWLKSRAAVRGSTLSSYGSIVRRRLIPHFGKMSLSEIGYDQVQNFVNQLAKEVAVKTLHNVIMCLRVMLVGKKGASAVKRGFLCHDPTRGVEMPTRDQKQVPPTPEEVWKLVDAGEEIGGPGRDMIFVDAFTGLRRNEILALQYTDIDWTNKELVINKAVSKTKVSDGVRKWEWRIRPPKSRKSNRRVAAAEAVLELLRHLRADAVSAGLKERRFRRF